MRRSGDPVVFGASGIAFCLACVGAAILFAWLTRVPLREEAERSVPAGSLLAYNPESDDSLVLYRVGGNVELAALRLNWRHLATLKLPSWRLGDASTEFPESTDPASLFVADCATRDDVCDDDVPLIGQINSGEIAFMEVAVDGSWRRFLSRAPGYVKLLGGGGRVGDVRWLDADNRVVWAIDRNGDGRIDPLVPGA